MNSFSLRYKKGGRWSVGLLTVFGFSGAAPYATRAQDVTPGPELTEIVVTAERRAEALKDVPFTVTVLTADALRDAGVSDTRNLQLVTTGLYFGTSGGFTAVTLRGVSSEQAGPGTDNNVAIYLDGVYMPSKDSGIFDFPDIAGIEVLKGPQGTLYGRNATGGAILFASMDPSFDFGGSASVGYGWYQDKIVKETVTGPLINGVLAGSLSGFYEDNEGYLNDIISGEKSGGITSKLVRAKLLLTPSDELKFLLAGYYSDRYDGNALNFTVLNGNTDGVFFGPTPVIIASQPGDVSSNVENAIHNKTTAESLRATYENAHGKLTSTTGFMNLDSRITDDGDLTSANATAYNILQPEKTFSEDLSFASARFGVARFLAGASYFYDDGKFNPVGVFVGVPPIPGNLPAITIRSDVRTNAIAEFLQVDLDVTDKLNIIGGARSTYERKSLYGSFAETFPEIASTGWRSTTPNASIKYAVSDSTNLYATYAQGFKSGVYNSESLSPVAVSPEHVDSFEVGIKSAPKPWISFNAAVFDYNYKNIQVSVYKLGGTELQNAAVARIYGIDIDATLKPMEDLVLKAVVEGLHATYTDFPNGSPEVPLPSKDCPGGYSACGNTVISEDLTGNHLPRAPDFTATLSADYVKHLATSEIKLNTNLYFTSKFYWEIGDRVSQSAYHVLNARASWQPNGSIFSVAIWGRNLTNTTYAQSAGIGGDGDGLLWAPPRTGGIEFDANF